MNTRVASLVILMLLPGLWGQSAESERGPGRAAGETTSAERAKYHRLMADLIEAQAAAEPDQALIARIKGELARLAPDPSDTPRGQGQGRGPRRGSATERGPGAGHGPGWRGGRGGPGGGPPNDPRFAEDRDLFHYLLSHREAIRRTVRELDNGVETLTESDDREVAATIQRHVESMHQRIQENRPIHLRDPLFAAVFANAAAVKMDFERTDKGMKVVETSNDPYVAKLIKAHADVVNGFVANGFSEVHTNHVVPDR